MAANKEHRDSGSYAPASNSTHFSLVNALLDIIKDNRDRLLVRILAETGCTSHELVHLRYTDIKENSIAFRAETTKNNAERIVSISKGLSIDLRQFGSESKPYVFSSGKSPRLRTASVRKILAKYSVQLGEKITSSSIRKAYLLESLSRKKPVEKIIKAYGISRLLVKKHLSEDKIARINAQEKSPRDQLIFDIIFATGCTLKELVQIKVRDVEFTSIVFSAVRPVTISERLSLQIQAIVKDSKLSGQDFLLSTRQSRAMSDKRVFQIIRHYADLAGIENINYQVLRNSCIARMASSGKKVEEISAHTGIQSIHRVDLYGSLMSND